MMGGAGREETVNAAKRDGCCDQSRQVPFSETSLLLVRGFIRGLDCIRWKFRGFKVPFGLPLAYSDRHFNKKQTWN